MKWILFASVFRFLFSIHSHTSYFFSSYLSLVSSFQKQCMKNECNWTSSLLKSIGIKIMLQCKYGSPIFRAQAQYLSKHDALNKGCWAGELAFDLCFLVDFIKQSLADGFHSNMWAYFSFLWSPLHLITQTI